MSTVGELNEMERNMVLQYVKSQDPQMTVALESGGSQDGTGPSFPIGISCDKLSVYPNGVFVFDYSIRAIEPLVEKTVRVQFYYNHVGLNFVSRVQRTQQGYAVVVPLKLQRIGEIRSYSKDDFKAVLSYAVKGQKSVELPCLPDREFDLFSRPSWKSVEPYIQSSVQQYYERFSYDLGKQDEDISYLISVCRYITRPQETEAVEGTAKPYDIIYIDTSRVILGSRRGESSPLKLSSNYGIQMEFGVFATDFFKRVIKASVTVGDIFSGKNGQKCFSCSFNGMKAEDERFLYEKFSGQKLTGR
ncbi:MAG: hypothetical protein ILP18_06435 [Treponema sp.]|nr:hypothetical protein [Treponema sp.]